MEGGRYENNADGQRVAREHGRARHMVRLGMGGEMSIARGMALVAGLIAICAVGAAAQEASAKPDGAALFKEHCAMCHVSGGVKGNQAPAMEVLAQKTQEEILRALESGPMVIYGNRMNEAERRAIATYLSSNTGNSAALARANMCPKMPGPMEDASVLDRWDGWGNGPENTRYQKFTRIGAENVSQLKLKWAFGIPDASTAYGQPSVVQGRLFFGSGDGTVYALNAETGCTIWTFRADTTVRTAVTIAGGLSGRYAAYFGDGEANLYALDADTGKLAWKVNVGMHRSARITGAPQFYRGILYVPLASNEELSGGDPNYPCCTFRGNVVAVNGLTGKLIWRGYAITDEPHATKNGESHAKFSPAGAAIWDTPTIDAKLGRLYVGTGDAYVDPAADGTDAVVAFDLATGKRLWVQQKTPNDVFNFGCIDPRHFNCPAQIGPDVDFGSSPILVDLGKGQRVLLCGQKTGVMYGLDPDDGGKELWEARIGKGSGLGGIEWGSATDGTNVYAANSDISTLTSPGANPPPPGGLVAIDIRTGKLLWKTMPPKTPCNGRPGCSGGQLAAVTAANDVVFSGAMDGHLRAYSAADGKILWDFDTQPEFKTVNGVSAHGGSMSGSGPTVSDNMVYVASGFTVTAGMAGNVVLAFELPSKAPAVEH
jgi:polyvinyl alcohol dehydrogenase (cytochrome)